MTKVIGSGTAFLSDELHHEKATVLNKTISENANNIEINTIVAFRKLVYELTEQGFTFRSQEILDELNKLEYDNS